MEYSAAPITTAAAVAAPVKTKAIRKKRKAEGEISDKDNRSPIKKRQKKADKKPTVLGEVAQITKKQQDSVVASAGNDRQATQYAAAAAGKAFTKVQVQSIDNRVQTMLSKIINANRLLRPIKSKYAAAPSAATPAIIEPTAPPQPEMTSGAIDAALHDAGVNDVPMQVDTS